MRITIKQFAIYSGVCRQTASKYYKMYLDILGTKRKYLTVYDIAKIDDVPDAVIMNKLGYK